MSSPDVIWDDEIDPAIQAEEESGIIWDDEIAPDILNEGGEGRAGRVLSGAMDTLTSGGVVRNIAEEGLLGGIAETLSQGGGRGWKIIQGISRNWGDEAVREAVDLVTDTDTAEEVRQKLLNFERNFEEEHPGMAFTSEMAGGMLGPGKFKDPAGVRQRIWNMAGGGAEGALAGAGAADDGDRGRGASRGGAWGFGIDTALGVPRAVANRVAKRRIAQEVGEDMPITMTDPDAKDSGWLRSFYDEWIGDAYGGKSSMYAQEQAVRDRVKAQADKAGGVVTRIKAGAAEEATEARTKLAATEGRVKEQRQYRTDERGLEKKLENLENTRGLNRGLAEAQDQYDEVLESGMAQDVKQTRQKIKKTAMPESMDDETRGFLEGTDDPAAFYTRLRKWWKDDAFQSVKGEVFDVVDDDVDGLVQDITGAVEDPKMLKELGDVENDIQALLHDVDDELFDHKLTGEDLISYRNGIARGSRFKAKGDAAITHAERRAVVDQIDAFINKQLRGKKPGAYAKFANDKKHYTAYLALRDTLESKKVVKAGGEFDADDFLTHYINYNPRAAAQRGLLEQSNLVEANLRQKDVPNLARAERDRLAGVRAQEIDRMAEARVRTDASDLQRNRQRMARLNRGLERRKASIDAREAAPEGLPEALSAQEAAQTQVDRYKGRGRSTGTGGSFARTAALATGMAPITYPIGAAGGPVGGALTTAAGGAGVAQVMATPIMQKLLAGQSVPQQELQAFLSRYDEGTVKQIIELLRRGTTVAGAGE